MHVSNHLDRTISNDTPLEKIGYSNKSLRLIKPLKEENFETKPTMDFYKAYCAELENTIELLTENLIAKTEKLNELDRVQTENLELKMKLKRYTKIMSLAQFDTNGCQEELCLANKFKITEMKNKYDRMLKQQNNDKISKLILNE